MKRTFTLLIGALMLASWSFAQETSSAQSNVIRLEFKSSPAKVTWLEPSEFSTDVKEKTFDLKLGFDVEGTDIQSVDIYVNDVPSDESRGFKKGNSLADRFDKFIERTISLQDGENTIRVVVTNADGTTIEESRAINKQVDMVAQLAVSSRKDYALVFGTDEYDEWNNLTNPVLDATTIAKELEEMYGFEVDLVLNPNKADIEQKIYGLYERSYMENDQILIFYAGHGQFNELTKQGYLVPKDGKLTDPIGSSYYSYSNLRDLVDGIPSEHVMLMLDACFGGTFDQDIARAGSRGQDAADLVSNTEFIKRKLRFKSRVYITSGGKEYVKDGRPGQHSPFAKQFLEALRSYGGSNGILTKAELKGYMEVLQQMPRMGDFGSYEPGSDFLFVAK
jgi:hypothetical protein